MPTRHGFGYTQDITADSGGVPVGHGTPLSVCGIVTASLEKEFVDALKAMGIKQVLSSPRSPWQRAYVERVIGTIRRECLDHMIVFNERSLQQHLRAFTHYYHHSRTHLALDKDAPEVRPVQPVSAGRIVASPEVSGLHHRYERRAA